MTDEFQSQLELIAHDMRSPLHVLGNFLDYFNRQQPPPELAEYYEAATRSLQKLTLLADKIITLDSDK